MFGKGLIEEVLGMVKGEESDKDISNSSTIFQCLSNSIKVYEEMINNVNSGRIRFISLTEEDTNLLQSCIISINRSLATAILTMVDILKRSKLDVTEFTTAVQSFLKSRNLDLIAYPDPLVALEAYGNHERIDKLMIDPRISQIELENYIGSSNLYKAGMVLDTGKPIYLWSILGKASLDISNLSSVYNANNSEAKFIFIKAFASIFVLTSSFGFDIIYLIDILNDEKTSF